MFYPASRGCAGRYIRWSYPSITWRARNCVCLDIYRCPRHPPRLTCAASRPFTDGIGDTFRNRSFRNRQNR